MVNRISLNSIPFPREYQDNHKEIYSDRQMKVRTEVFPRMYEMHAIQFEQARNKTINHTCTGTQREFMRAFQQG